MHLHKPHTRSSKTSELSRQAESATAGPSSGHQGRGRVPRPRVTLRPSAAFGWLFITFVMATGPLEAAVPDQSGSAYFSAAALGGFAVLGALLLAELRRARRMALAGIAIERVELGLLRARAVADTEPQTPSSLRRVNWAGLLTLATSAIVLGAAGGLLTLASTASFKLFAATALFAAAAIAFLALTELIPAPGSPGSQLIFARAWRRSGQRDAAVVATAKAGVVSGWIVAAAGVAILLFLSFAGIWLMMLGVMVTVASRVTLSGAQARQRLSGLRARDVMSPAPPEVSSFLTVGTAFATVALPSRAELLIVREPDGSFGGLVPVRALAAVPGDDREHLRVLRLTIPPSALATVAPEEPMERVLERLAAQPAAGVAVVMSPDAPDSPIGLVTPADVAHTIALMDAKAGGKAPGGPFSGPFNGPFRPFR